jgi:uridine kinase
MEHRTIDINTINYNLKNNTADFIREAEAFYYNQIYKTAEIIDRNASGKPLVLLSGPSGSGKTTTALAYYGVLLKWGHRVYVISMDHYYKNHDRRRAPKPNIDLESPARLNIELLNAISLTIWLRAGR